MIIHTIIKSIGGESYTVIGRDPEVSGWTYGEVWFDNSAAAETYAAVANNRDKDISLKYLLRK